MVTKSVTELSPRSFGAFYPTGHLVIFFANKGGADDPIGHYFSE